MTYLIRLFPLLCLLLVVGCKTTPDFEPPARIDYDPNRPGLPSYSEVVAGYNANAEHATRLWSRAVVELYWYDDKGRRRRETGDDSTLIMKLPDQLALSVGKLGQTGLWIGADATRYWLIDLLADEKTAYVGTHAGAVIDPRRIPLPLHPAQLPWLLGLRRIDPTQLPPEPAVEWLDGGLLIEPPGENVRLLLDASTLLVRRVVLLDAAGRATVNATASHHGRLRDNRIDEAKWAAIPLQIEASIVGEPDRMVLKLNEPFDGGRRVRDAAFDFELLVERFGPDRVVDLDAPPAER